MAQRFLIIPLFVFFIVACGEDQSEKVSQLERTIEELRLDSASARPVLDSLRNTVFQLDSLLDLAKQPMTTIDNKSDSIALYELMEARYEFYSKRYSSPWQIITTGSFHGEEVSPELADEEWLGLAKEKEQYSLQPVDLKLAKDFDVIVDLGGTDSTGIRVIPDPSKEMHHFIKGPGLDEGPIRSWIKPGVTLYPGVQKYLGNKNGYQLMVEANVHYDEGRGQNLVSYYKLSVVWNSEDGSVKTQLIDGNPYIDESPFQLLFAGDLDNDGIPDLIIRNAFHYNTVEALGLFLSRPAEEGKKLKHVAQFFAVGC